MTQQFYSALNSAQCFLWDFDGCFADTERLHFVAYQKAFAAVGHVISEEDYYPSFTHLGDGTRREIITHGLKIEEQDIVRAKAEAYLELIRSGPVTCFSETLPLVRLMHRCGAKVAIASNSSEKEILTVLTTAGFPIGEVDLIVGKTAGLKKKPAPDIFLHALERLGMTAERAIVLEDSNRGLEAAAAAGCAALWIRTRYNAGLQTSQPFLKALSHQELLQQLEALHSPSTSF
jgi:HAD superfamily hydrolase (TIGR01509 family)